MASSIRRTMFFLNELLNAKKFGQLGHLMQVRVQRG
jgi:hypothetical protein